MAKGKVIAAFPATGKSYLAATSDRYADSDSSAFSWAAPGERHPDWPRNYIEHVQALLKQGKVVLCSTHEEVREALVAAGIPFTLVYPSDGQREEYAVRMFERGSDKRLIDFITDNWIRLLTSCWLQQHCDHIVLPAGRYLSEVNLG